MGIGGAGVLLWTGVKEVNLLYCYSVHTPPWLSGDSAQVKPSPALDQRPHGAQNGEGWEQPWTSGTNPDSIFCFVINLWLNLHPPDLIHSPSPIHPFPTHPSSHIAKTQAELIWTLLCYLQVLWLEYASCPL